MPTFDWTRWERDLFDELRRALKAFAKRHPAERLSALALHGVYRELDGQLLLPALAASTVERGPPAETPSSFWSNPPDWPHHLELRHQPALKLEKALTAEATRGTVRHWRAVEKTYFALLVRVTRALRAEALELSRTTDDFICFWHDEEGGPSLARKTIPLARWKRLFAREAGQQRAREALASAPPNERATFLVSRFGQFEGVTSEHAQAELRAMGREALPALEAGLSDPKHGWVAAKLLGQLGTATPSVLTALRRRADELWFAMALGLLGDVEWLARQAPRTACLGLTAPLKAITTRDATPRPLDYAPLETWLTKTPSARALVEDELAPGRSFVTLHATDVPEAVRALESRFAVVRWHAASLLGERSLGAKAAKTILPALAGVLDDRSALVRRLAVLSLERWKSAAKAHHLRFAR